MNSIQGLRDLDGTAVEFGKIAPGGFVVVEIDGAERLISRERWDALPHWGTIGARRPLLSGPSHGALVIALIATVILICEIVAWLIGCIISSYAFAKRMAWRQLKYSTCVLLIAECASAVPPL